jgi:nucleoid-associated protein YgaU
MDLASTQQKLVIHYETEADQFGGAVQVMFNPVTLIQSRTVSWSDVPGQGTDPPSLKYTSMPTETLTIDLIFDTSEESDGNQDVRQWTAKIYNLTMLLPDKHRPPMCQLAWGAQSPFFQGVLQSLSPTYKYFLPDGTAVRSKLTCIFKGWDMQLENGLQMQSTDVEKSHVVRRGDTLASISRRQLHDARLWRVIARANGITDPLSLTPGQRLHIPKYRSS